VLVGDPLYGVETHLELGKANPTFIYSNPHEGKLEFYTTVLHYPSSLDLDQTYVQVKFWAKSGRLCRAEDFAYCKQLLQVR
jgi:hypothetical protein